MTREDKVAVIYRPTQRDVWLICPAQLCDSVNRPWLLVVYDVRHKV